MYVSGAKSAKIMRYGYFAFALILILKVDSSLAFELNNPEPDKRRMTIELEVVPTPPQKDFEQYVQEQATAAQRDAKDAGSKSNEQLAKHKQPKPLNPITLFRW
jgi:hypothetical protein